MLADQHNPTARTLWSWQEGSELCLRLVDYPPNLRQPAHYHDYSSVTLVIRGAVHEESAHHCEQLAPMCIAIKRPRVLHADLFGPNGCLTLQIRLREDLANNLLGPLPTRLVHSSGAIIGNLLSLTELGANAAPACRSGKIEDTLYDALASLPETRSCSSAPPRWLFAVKDFLDRSPPSRRPTLKQLAAPARVHPVHLTRQFKRTFGVSIRAYMKQRRVRAAMDAVGDGTESLAEIAYAFGYADQSHLCRDFRSFANLSPTRYRLLLKDLRRRAG